MLQPSEIRVGILCATSSVDRNALCVAMALAGLAEHNVEIKHIPGNRHVAMGVLFFAEYTEVDCVLVVTDSELDVDVRKTLLELQMQWNMPLDYTAPLQESMRVSLTALVEMVQLQSEMAADVPAERVVANNKPRKDNIN